MSLITLKDVTKTYGTIVKQQVLFDIELEFERNTFNSIIGQSGSGKSTLLNIMGTLDQPTTGKVSINGRSIDGMPKHKMAELRNEEIGFIFQFHYLLPEYTVFENVVMPYRIKEGGVTQEIQERADHLLDVVGLTQVRDNNALAISGGQAQRTAVARALINRPSIVLADEPTGNLDSESSNTVYNLLRDLNDEYGTTFVVITHDNRVAERTDRIIELKDGRVIKDFLT